MQLNEILFLDDHKNNLVTIFYDMVFLHGWEQLKS